MLAHTILLGLLPVVIAQQPQYPPAFPLGRPTLASAANYAPSVTPNVADPTAPNAQEECPGYKASNVQETNTGVTADLTLAGPVCSVYGNDIEELSLSVEYQSQNRLSVRIYPKYLVPGNESLYILSPTLTPQPDAEPGCTKANSDLVFTWSNTPSFQFQVSRASSGEVLFDTYGSVIVFEDQFLELVTSMKPEYNIYGLAESLRSFRLPHNFTQTFWNAYNLDNDQELNVNGHSVHPMYLETRYANGSSQSHGFYARNAHGQDWLLAAETVTYRTIGGSFDLYFVSGPTPKGVISQYQAGIVNTPVLPAYWHLGFHQVRWSYQNWTNLQEVIDGYADAGIQLEGIMNDLDYLQVNRDFTDNPGHYDIRPGKEFLDRLHAAGQYYMPILDPNIYVPNPNNASDAYPTYDRGAELQAYIRNGNDSWYYGVEWPGFSVWPDFIVPQAQQFWTEQFLEFHQKLDYDGFWLDVSDADSFCTGSCGQGLLGENPIHVPFALPGDPNSSVAVDYRYPEMFNVTNATEAASASSAMMSQAAAYPTPLVTPTPTVGRTLATPGVRNLTFPPYAINNFLPGHSLLKQVISPNATHNDGPYNSTEYALQFSIVGIPYFGVETCGFNGNADLELCTRWMQLSAWFPLYRNHNNRNTIAQEAYRWATTAEATRRIMNIRYSLLPYTYTLFHKANVAGETVLRALAWEFPDEEDLKAVETQFMSGPSLLITPVLTPLATTVQGVFPGLANGTIWYDWYSLQAISAAPGENKTLAAPLEHQPIHVRGGSIIPIQQAGNTTATSRKMPWSLLIALDKNGEAVGELYLDDGISLAPNATKNVELSYANNTLRTSVSGQYEDALPLANVTIAGIKSRPHAVYGQHGNHGWKTWSGGRAKLMHGDGDVLFVTGLDKATQSGAWSANLELRLQ
ncbi:hypothetical protein LTR85_008854 [Meristemomyces frigidus]|nr:hypothetical protein LTR85_008854 [Meristemomyces frigidus]